ncbi:hypothetical protein ScalyP_jg9597 [Parmales sp. scaly parma]|nr:hypothetical protein ScalyP_jg9597 [Parmales sp. scaly parma]
MSGLGRRSHYRKHVTDSMLNDFPVPNRAAGDRVARVTCSRGGNLLELTVEGLPSLEFQQADASPSSCSSSCSSSSSNNSICVPSTHISLALLPTKFNKLVWVKRGDFVIVSGSSVADVDIDVEYVDMPTVPPSVPPTVLPVPDTARSVPDNPKTPKTQYIVKSILFADQVKHIKKVGEWPDCFQAEEVPFNNEESSSNTTTTTTTTTNSNDTKIIDPPLNNDDEYDSGEDDANANSLSDHLFVNTNRIARMIVAESDSDSADES